MLNEIIIKDAKVLKKLQKLMDFYTKIQFQTTEEDIATRALERYLNQKKESLDFGVLKKTKSLRFWEDGGGKCHYCRQLVPYELITLDHKQPIFRGGDTKEKNIACSCYWCNIDKGNLTEEEYFYKQLHNTAVGIFPPPPENNPNDKRRFLKTSVQSPQSSLTLSHHPHPPSLQEPNDMSVHHQLLPSFYQA